MQDQLKIELSEKDKYFQDLQEIYSEYESLKTKYEHLSAISKQNVLKDQLDDIVIIGRREWWTEYIILETEEWSEQVQRGEHALQYGGVWENEGVAEWEGADTRRVIPGDFESQKANQ